MTNLLALVALRARGFIIRTRAKTPHTLGTRAIFIRARCKTLRQRQLSFRGGSLQLAQ